MNRRDLFRLLIAAPLAAMVKVPTAVTCTWQGPGLKWTGKGSLTLKELLHARKLLNEASVGPPQDILVPR